MKKETVEIRINKEGGFTFKALEGFSGSSCVERTRNLELALGGHAISTEKTDDYYKTDDSSPININLR